MLTAMALTYLALAVLVLLRDFRQLTSLLRAAWRPPAPVAEESHAR